MGQLFFAGGAEGEGLLGSLAVFAVSFLARPIGGLVFGRLGDRIGRQRTLAATMIMMAASTFAIGLLPTYAAIGGWATLLLVLCRLLQGFSTGGEYAGATTFVSEYAPDKRRGFLASILDTGSYLGFALGAAVVSLLQVVLGNETMLEWGWRVPFLLSVVLIGVGYVVRRAVEESPVFQEIAEKKQQAKAPAAELFKKHWLLVILAALVFAGNNAAGYMATGGFIPSYATSDAVGLERTDVLLAITFAAAMWFVFTALAGILSDKIGRKKTYLIGFSAQLLAVFPLFWLINTGSLPMLYLALGLFTVGLGLGYGPQAAWYSEIFPASVRFSGVSISYALGAILGGAFAPTIATALVQATGTSTAVSVYLFIMTAVSIAAVLILRDRPGIDLSINNQAEQEVGATIFDKRRGASTDDVDVVKTTV
jgi:MFS family permease